MQRSQSRIFQQRSGHTDRRNNAIIYMIIFWRWIFGMFVYVYVLHRGRWKRTRNSIVQIHISLQKVRTKTNMTNGSSTSYGWNVWGVSLQSSIESRQRVFYANTVNTWTFMCDEWPTRDFHTQNSDGKTRENSTENLYNFHENIWYPIKLDLFQMSMKKEWQFHTSIK